MYIATEPEIHRAVVTQNGAINRHLASDRHIGIAMQHLVAQQVQRELRSRHVRADHIERCNRQLADKRPGHSLHRRGKHPDQSASQTHQLGGVYTLEELGPLVDRGKQLSWLPNIQWNGDRYKGDAIP